jgi:chromosome segregation ATPase
MSDGNWVEYKQLVLKELERNDENQDKLLKEVQGNSEKLSGIGTSIESINTSITELSKQERVLENRLIGLERDFSSIKTKVIIIGSIIASASAGAFTLLMRFLQE